MAKLVECKTCKKEIAKSASKCPSCGARQSARIWPWVLVGLIVVIGISANAAKDKEKKQKEAVASGANAIDVTSRQLYLDYKANEVSADSKYKGKVLRVSGRVHSVAKDFTDEAYVTIDVGEMLDNVRAKFQSDAALGSLQKGQQITVRCRGDNVVLGSPKLADCVLE